jgi:hypothetical protein
MTSGTFKTWNSIEEYLENVPNGRIELTPGDAVYFLGGRKSLYRFLVNYSNRSVRCTGAGSVSIAARPGFSSGQGQRSAPS